MELDDKRKREEEAAREKEKEQKELEQKIAEEKKRIAAWEQKNANSKCAITDRRSCRQNQN